MSDLKEKIAYLQGLAAGLEMDKDSKEGKLFNGMMDVLGEMAIAIDELESYVEALDQDLGDAEDVLYGDDDDFEDYEDDQCPEGCCDGDYIEVACPKCHEVLHIDSCMLTDDAVAEIACPNCEEILHVNEETNPLLNEPEKKES